MPRYHKLRYQGYDQHGEPIDRTVEGFHARVAQHECDHSIPCGKSVTVRSGLRKPRVQHTGKVKKHVLAGLLD